MRRNAKSITTSPEIVRHIEGLTEANFNFLVKLLPWLADNEKTQHKFRMAVLSRLAKIDAMLTEIQGCQLADFWSDYRLTDEKRAQYINEVQERVAQASERSGVESVKYIYTETKATESASPPRDRRRKWHGWEI